MLKVREIMTKDAITATPDMTLQEAMELLSERHVGGVPVVQAGKVVGIFSAADLLAYMAELSETTPSISFKRSGRRTPELEEATVGDVMTRRVHSLTPESPVDEAAWIMTDKHIHRLLVMDGDTLVGIVSSSDVAKAVANHRIKTRTFVFS